MSSHLASPVAILFKTSVCFTNSDKFIAWKFCARKMCSNNVSLEISNSAAEIVKPAGIGSLDVSGAGLLNSEQYYQRYVRLIEEHPISKGARTFVEASILYRKNLKKAGEVIKAIFATAKDVETKNLTREAGQWMARVLHSSSNTVDRMPVHAVVSSQPGRMFLLFVSCTADLNSLQFSCLITSQSWLAQLNINNSILGKVHQEYQRHYWTDIVKTTTRSKEDYTEGREFRNEFNESFYANLTGDSYLVPIYSSKRQLWNAHMLGRRELTFSGYDLKDLLVIREQVLLRDKIHFQVMRGENHASLRKWLDWFKGQNLPEFEAALSELRPDLSLRSAFAGWRQGDLDAQQVLIQVGLLNSDARKDYFELTRGVIEDDDFDEFAPTSEPISLSQLKKTLTTVYTREALEAESAPIGEPSLKRTKRGKRTKRAKVASQASSSIVVEEGRGSTIEEQRAEGGGADVVELEGFEIIEQAKSISLAEKKVSIEEDKATVEAKIKARQNELVSDLGSFLAAIEEAKVELSGESSGSDSTTRFNELDAEKQKELLFVKLSDPSFMNWNSDMTLKDQVLTAIKLHNADV